MKSALDEAFGWSVAAVRASRRGPGPASGRLVPRGRPAGIGGDAGPGNRRPTRRRSGNLAGRRSRVIHLPQQEVLAFDHNSPEPAMVGDFLTGLDRLAIRRHPPAGRHLGLRPASAGDGAGDPGAGRPASGKAASGWIWTSCACNCPSGGTDRRGWWPRWGTTPGGAVCWISSPLRRNRCGSNFSTTKSFPSASFNVETQRTIRQEHTARGAAGQPPAAR